MKRSIIFIMITLISVVSCSKDSNSTSSEKIIGTWGKLIVKENGFSTTKDPADPNNQIIINADGTLRFSGVLPTTGTWKNMGSGNYKIENVQNGIPFSTTYKISFTGTTQMLWTTTGSSLEIVWQRVL